MSTFVEFLQSSVVGPFILLLGPLIFVHELGHFLVAKLCGVRVEVFSLGFGKKILKYKHGDTTYCLSLIPLGGYVKMFGDDPSMDVPEDQKSYSFLHKPVAPRIAIVLAGPLMNLVFAIFLYSVISMIGEQAPAPIVGDVAPATAAAEAGFLAGDKILSVEGSAVQSWNEIREQIEASAGKALHFQVSRGEGSAPVELVAEPKSVPNENPLGSKPMVGRIQGLDPDSLGPVVGVSGPDSLAAKAGVSNLDEVTAVNGKPVRFYRELVEQIGAGLSGGAKTIQLSVRSVLEENAKDRNVSVDVPGNAANEGLAALGLTNAELILARVKPDSPAAKAGMQIGDRIVSVNNKTVSSWNDVVEMVKNFTSEAPPMTFTVSRMGQEQNFTVTPELTKLMADSGKEEQRFTIGILSGTTRAAAEPVLIKTSNVGKAFLVGCQRSMEVSKLMILGIAKLVTGEISSKNVGGVITIGRFASRSIQIGLASFLTMMAFISINLFLVNLLPVPVLDGGHLVFFTVEALQGAPISMRKMEVAQQVGLFLLMSLMAFALFNDITHLFNAW